MKIIYYVFALIGISFCQRPLITKELYNQILSQSDWEPFPIEDNQFIQYELSEAKNFLGLLKLMPNETLMIHQPSERIIHQRNLNSYDSFDGREKWPCVNYIENQLKCGASWAFAITNVLSDRLCASDNNFKPAKLSIYNLLTCDFLNYACKGGSTISALIHLVNNGIVLEKCQKISFKNVELKCEKSCQNKRIPYKTTKINKMSLKRITDIKEIKDNIFENGPIYSEMEVYEDLFHYKRGIYKNVSKNLLGYHAVRIVGWGLKDNKPYWIVANTWGKWWGEDGFFRISFDSSKISKNILAFAPLLE